MEEEVFEYPVDGVLDLHQFHPRDVPSVVKEYLNECRQKGIYQVKIIHGKGKGWQKSVVISILKELSYVIDFHDDSGSFSGWGATVTNLKPGDNER